MKECLETQEVERLNRPLLLIEDISVLASFFSAVLLNQEGCCLTHSQFKELWELTEKNLRASMRVHKVNDIDRQYLTKHIPIIKRMLSEM